MEIASGIGGLLGIVTSTILSLNNIIGKYGMLDDTASLIVSNCEATRLCLKSIRDEMKRNPGYATNLECRSILNTTLAGCSSILKVLSIEMNAIQSEMITNNKSSLSRRQKLKILWNWDTLKFLLENLNEQKGNLNLVLNIIQNDKLNKIEQLLLRRGTLVSTAEKSHRLLLEHKSKRNENHVEDDDDDTGSVFKFSTGRSGLQNHHAGGLPRQMSQLRNDRTRSRESIGLRAPNVLNKTARLSSKENLDALNTIFTALEHRDYEELERLCLTTDHSLKDKRGHTILSAAVHLDDLRACEIIIRHGSGLEARCSLKSCRGCRPIHIAAMNDSVETIRLLLEHGVNVGALTQLDRTALHWAAEYDSVDAFRLLAKRRLSMKTVDAEEDTVLHIAARSHSLNVLAYVRKNMSTDSFMRALTRKNKLGQSPIQIMVDTDWDTAVNLVVKDLPQPSTLNYADLNWLFYAAFEGAHRTLFKLIVSGFDVNAYDNCGYTPSHYAVLSDGDVPKTLRILHNSGSELEKHWNRYNGQNSSHSTMYADFTNDQLRAAQTKLHRHDGTRNLTVLHLAAEEADLDVVQQLLDLDANTQAIKSCGCNVLKSARNNNDPKVFLAICDYLFNPERTRDVSEEVLALACASKQDFNRIYDRVQSASHSTPSTGSHSDQGCRCGTFSIQLLNTVLGQGDLPIMENRYLDCDALGYCANSKNYAAVLAIANKRTGSALQPGEKDCVHDTLLLAECGDAPNNVKQALRALCPEIVASVQEVLEEAKKLEREEKEKEAWEDEMKRQRERERERDRAKAREREREIEREVRLKRYSYTGRVICILIGLSTFSGGIVVRALKLVGLWILFIWLRRALSSVEANDTLVNEAFRQ